MRISSDKSLLSCSESDVSFHQSYQLSVAFIQGRIQVGVIGAIAPLKRTKVMFSP